jgi:hypothetical protein
LHDLLEEKLQVVKKFDEEILQLCEVKEIENEIEVSEELNYEFLMLKDKYPSFLRRKSTIREKYLFTIYLFLVKIPRK